MLFIGLTMLGYISYRQLPVELLPNAELPLLIVQVGSRTEVEPGYMEKQGIIPLEGAIGTLEGIDQIESTADRRRGIIFVYYNQDTDIKYAYLKLQEKIDQARTQLPDEFEVFVIKIDTEQISNMFMSLQARGGGGTNRVRNVVDESIRPKLESIDGIANVEVYGGREKTVEIVLNNKACESLNITASQVRQAIVRNHRNKTYIGNIDEQDKRYFVNLTADYQDIQQIENIIVKQQGQIKLKDIAGVFFGLKQEQSISRINGKEAVTIMLMKDNQVNQIDLAHKVQAEIQKLNDEMANKDVEIVIEENRAETMEENIDMIIELASVGGLLAVFVLWIFLRNFTLVTIIAFSIPISVFAAFNFFYSFGISINNLTLVGMALAIGMLLDNSIVVLENIYRTASGGKPADVAVIRGTKEVWRSIFAATLTTIMVFLPFAFSENFFISLIGHHIGVSIISTLVVSFLVAMLLIPMAAHFFLQKKQIKNVLFFQKITIHNILIQRYVLFLKACMRKPARTIIGAVVFFFITVFACLAVSVSVSREVEISEFKLYVTMPSGATLESTDKVAADIEQKLEGIEEIEDILSQINEEDAVITIQLRDNFEDVNKKSIPDIKQAINDKTEEISHAEISFEQPQSSSRFRQGAGGGGGDRSSAFMRLLGIGTQQEKIVVKGEDYEKMKSFAYELEYYLRDFSSVSEVDVSASEDRPEIHLRFNPVLITEYNIPLVNILSGLNTFQDEISTNIKFKEGTEEYDVIIKIDEHIGQADPRTMDDLKTMPVESPSGGVYELQKIAGIFYSSGLGEINRVNQEKQIEVMYQFERDINNSNELLESSRMEVDNLVAALNIPPGLAVEVVHEERDLSDFYFLIVAAIILIYMILASVFESFYTPFVLMFSIPLAAMGSFLALVFTGNSLFNANTLTGFLILIGIVVNNGIILIDYTNILRKRGNRPQRALLLAGMARVRPIAITAITTIIGMLPLALGNVEYVKSIGAPFAITVIGGLTLSTFFTLLFIPTLYSGLESALKWFRGLKPHIKLINFITWGAGIWLIYEEIDSLVFQLLDGFLVFISAPALTYFIMNSLRKAKTSLIDDKEPLFIKISNIVKIYDRESTFRREWKGAKKIRERTGSENEYTSWRDFDQFIWQIPVFGFLIYFTWFYINHNFWLFVMPHIVYFYTFYMLKPVEKLIFSGDSDRIHILRKKIFKSFVKLFFWLFPLLNLVIFQIRWENIAVVIIIGLTWYISLAVYKISDYLHKSKINIHRLQGRFRKLRYFIFNLVLHIPLIGKRKIPFKALKGTNITIENGMFGLLGPNGAGKSTLMKIICGILEQSYGKIWINGYDTQEKREELQGLIGYLPQEFGMYENMTAYEYLDYLAILKNITDEKIRNNRILTVLEEVNMVDNKNQKISSFSGGMKQRIGIAQILLHLPKILVVDEPTAGLDPRERIRFRNLLVELSRERIVIFSTHIIEDISSSCNKIAVLNKGEVRYTGDPAEMAKTAEGHVWQFYVHMKEFEDIYKNHLVVHHMRDGDKIRVRCIAKDKPVESAKPLRPNLEDGYLWLQRN